MIERVTLFFARILFCVSGQKTNFTTGCIRSAPELPLPPAQYIFTSNFSNNFNGTGQIALNCLSQKPSIKEIGQISNLTKEKIVYKFFSCVSLKWSIFYKHVFCSFLKRLNKVWAQVYIIKARNLAPVCSFIAHKC